MPMRQGVGTVGLALFLAWLPVAVAAQTAEVGRVIGDVQDASGGTVRGATVTLTNSERGISRKTVTDTLGRFLFAAVPPGRYDLIVTLSKFTAARLTGHPVEAEKATRVSIMVDQANIEDHTRQTRLRADEFQLLPFARNYQTLLGATAGIVGTGNVNAHGALSTNNVFLFDGVNTTDPTTGTSAANLNYDAIDQVLVRTSTVPIEFGRATGAIVDVITKSGTNTVAGSYKFLMTNDRWNAQNNAVSEVAPGAPLARTRFNTINPLHSVTAGGPIVKNRAWFFAAFEDARNTTPERQTNAAPGVTPESYQQTTESPFVNVRLTTALASNHKLWARITRSPTNGFINDYYGGFAAERAALTRQDQGSTSFASQYTGVFGTTWTGEVLVAHASTFLNVSPFTAGPTHGGAAIFDEIDGRWYNGSTFDGYIRRPRTQVTAAVSYFPNIRGRGHTFKVGVDWQQIQSTNSYNFPTATEFDVVGFDPVTRTYFPDLRVNYVDVPSRSTGMQLALYGRDRFQIGSRASVEAGVRLERQTSHSDVTALTVDTLAIAPRISASYAVTGDSGTLLVGSYGRFHDGVLQGFSDNFAAVPQQTNYDLHRWNGSAYVLIGSFTQSASTFVPNTKVTPRYMDEYTGGVEHRINRVMGISARAVYRKWANFIDDVRTFDATGAVSRVVTNVPNATRTYRGLEVMADRRLADRWMASANYTWSQTKGNHFANDFSPVGDFVDETCQQSAGGLAIDQGLGEAHGLFPCAIVQTNLAGRPSYDRPHAVKLSGAYVASLGSFSLSTGVVGALASKATYTKARTVNVVVPGTVTPSGQTLTYLYEPRGTDRIPGLSKTIDASVEATRRIGGRPGIGIRLDVFNLFNTQDKIGVNNTSWCASAATASCQAAVAVYGAATVRGSFETPRTYRVSFVVRY